jgi:transposase
VRTCVRDTGGTRSGATAAARRGEINKEIAKLLDVSPSSVSRWTADITLTPGFIEALRQRNPAINSRLNGTREQSAAARAIRLHD